jgi:SAM-dependent methyltransferase
MTMSVAELQGSLWGARARDYSLLVEGFFRPVYERVLEETAIGPGTALLDVACGPGLAAQLASRRGAKVAGLDAAAAAIAIARERMPHGDFRTGDMEELPWPDAAFDIVTSFNGFQFAADLASALREARRVTRVGGRVAMVVWGPDEACDTPAIVAAVRGLLPPQPPGSPMPPLLWTPGRLEALLQQAGLLPVKSGDVACPFVFPDLESAARGLMSAGAAVAVVERVGAEPVYRAIAEALRLFKTDAGGYLLRNSFHYVIGSS